MGKIFSILKEGESESMIVSDLCLNTVWEELQWLWYLGLIQLMLETLLTFAPGM